ncbi:MAG: hypothetical protein J0M17_11780 [Planctomycetes bacterium]|nr:hypothetical protein [Planctomycetota bacterium]
MQRLINAPQPARRFIVKRVPGQFCPDDQLDTKLDRLGDLLIHFAEPDALPLSLTDLELNRAVSVRLGRDAGHIRISCMK